MSKSGEVIAVKGKKIPPSRALTTLEKLKVCQRAAAIFTAMCQGIIPKNVTSEGGCLFFGHSAAGSGCIATMDGLSGPKGKYPSSPEVPNGLFGDLKL